MAKNAKTQTHPDSAPLSHQAYERLKAEILQCILKPGVEVTESWLAERYELGKAPVRAALSRLCNDGLIEALPRRGHRIVPITLRDIYDIFDMRLLLEPAAARRAAGRIDEDRLKAIAAACDPENADNPSSAYSAYISNNAQFHIFIAESSGSHRLAASVTRLLEDSQRARYLGVVSMAQRDVMADQHAKLVNALVAGNGDLAAEIAAEHIRTGRELVIGALLSLGDVLDQEIVSHEPSASLINPEKS